MTSTFQKWPSEKPQVEKDDHGWFTWGSEKVFEKLLSEKTQVVVELGSWLGKSTRFILDHAPNATVYAIDHWKGCVNHQRKENFQERLSTLYETFLVNCWEYRDRLVPVKTDTILGLEEIHHTGLKPDIVYIDASHDYKSVLADIEKTIELFPEAQIIGDDWLWGGQRPVKQAAEKCAKDNNLTIEVVYNTWYYENRKD